MREDPIARRVGRQVGVPDLLARLTDRGLAQSDVNSLMLAVARHRSWRRRPAELLDQSLRDRSVRATGEDARTLARLTVAAFDAVPAFEAIDLSPVEPVGLNTVLGAVDQNSVLATARATEVVGDPTSPLALVAAARRRAGEDAVRLATCHRVLRMQRFDPSLEQHFRLFALVTATRSRADHGAELDALCEHVGALLDVVEATRPLGARYDELLIRISDTRVHKALVHAGIAPAADAERPRDAIPGGADVRLGRLEAAAERLAPVVGRHPQARLLIDLTRAQAVNYYDGLTVAIDAVTGNVARNLADGGSVDWTARLLHSKREQLFTSGIGLARLLG